MVEKIPYLKDLGITVVELMPVFQYDPSDSNYWGYMPLNFLGKSALSVLLAKGAFYPRA